LIEAVFIDLSLNLFYKGLGAYYEERDFMKGSALNDFILPGRAVGFIGILVLLAVLLL